MRTMRNAAKEWHAMLPEKPGFSNPENTALPDKAVFSEKAGFSDKAGLLHRAGRAAASAVSRRRTVPLLVAGGVAAAALAAVTANGALAAPSGPAAPAAFADASAGGRLASQNPGAGVPAADLSSAAVTLCVKVAAKAGFSFNDTVATSLGREPQIVVAVSIAMAESSCDPKAVFHDPDGSEDRGLWQINNRAWPGVSDACAFDAQCNADAAWKISAKGADWNPWSTFGNGAWKNFVSAAKAAVTGGFTVSLRDQKAGTCVAAEADQNHNGGTVFQQACKSGDKREQWTVLDTLGKLPVLRNAATNLCLDVDPSQLRNGGKVFQWACDRGAQGEQWWFRGSGRFDANGDADAGLKNEKSARCLAADGKDPKAGGAVFQQACDGRDALQLWN